MIRPAIAISAHWLSRAFGVLLFVSLITFVMLESLPGDLAFKVSAARYDLDRITPAVVESVEGELGFDRGPGERYLLWLRTLLAGDLGRSAVSNMTVWETIELPLQRTLALVALSWPLMILIGVTLGAWLGRTQRGLVVAQILGAAASSIPTFVMGLVLVLIFSISLNLLPSAGYGGLSYLILPVATLSLRGAGRVALVTAVSTREAAQHPSVEFARIKGLPEHEVTARHVIPLSAPPIIAVAFFCLAGLLVGVTVVEIVFAYPGIGKLLVDSVMAGDVPVVQGITLTIAMLILASNAIGDLLVRHFDPQGGA